MEQRREEEQEARLGESLHPRLGLARDEEVLNMIESPPPPHTRGDLAWAAASVGRGGLVLRAGERGVPSADTRCGNGAYLVHVAAANGPLELLTAHTLPAP